MRRSRGWWVLAMAPVRAIASRFPQPQFESGHQAPQAWHPPFQALTPPWADALILALALALGVWLVRRARSRRWIQAFSVACLVWFGFIRHGCICPVGAIQNVAVAVWAGGGLPWAVAVIFALPLLTALFYGRIFCAAVCPLGALQELFIIRPLRAPRALDAALRLAPPAVLGIGVVYAIHGAGYLICRTDPFVGLFRRSAPLPMLLTGMAVLMLGMVLARPYCRYFCPYGVLLEVCSRLAWRRVKITEETCVNCRLCVGVCPVGAVAGPREALNEKAWAKRFRHFLVILALAPLLVAATAGAGWLSGAFVAKAHPAVALAVRLAPEMNIEEDFSPEIEAFRRGGESRESAVQRGAEMVQSFRRGCAWAGVFLGVVVVLRLIGLTRLPRLKEHEADRIRCVACGRCYPACPKNRPRLAARAAAAPG